MIDPTGSSLGNSLDIQQDLRNQLKAILPQAFSDNNLDFEKLKQLLGDDFTSPREERYGISWAGKTEAFRELQQTTTNTLSPSPLTPDGGTPLIGEIENCGGAFIEGENLEVLKVLQKSYYGKVKMIYIDPPYNTGNDSFVYPDDFSETKAEYQEKGNINLNRLNLWQKNSKDSGKYHSSWLSMMYPRLFMARNLLREDGVIFISIDDNEQANLKLLMDEVFGEENFVACLIWRNGRTSASHFTNEHEYILVYCKNKITLPFFSFDGDEIISDRTIKKPGQKNPPSTICFPAGIQFESEDKVFPNEFGTNEPVKVIEGIFEAKNEKLAHDVILEAGWTMKDMIEDWLDGENVIDQKGQKVTRFFFKSNGVLQYEKEKGTIHPKTIFDFITTKSGSKELTHLLNGNFFDFPKPHILIKRILEIVTKPNDLILDFFAGSGTTALELNTEDGGNRQFICVQMPEPTDPNSEAYKAGYQTIADITRARIEKVQEKLPFRAAAVAGGGIRPYGVGFYKLQPSNFKIWQSDIDTEEELLAQLELYAQPHTTPETPEENLLTELMLKAGFMLTANVQTISTADGIKLYDIENGTMTVALSALSEKVILTICERKPKEFICLDNLFESDVQKSNWSLQLAEAGVNLQVI